jgi:hypothetical protein
LVRPAYPVHNYYTKTLQTTEHTLTPHMHCSQYGCKNTIRRKKKRFTKTSTQLFRTAEWVWQVHLGSGISIHYEEYGLVCNAV